MALSLRTRCRATHVDVRIRVRRIVVASALVALLGIAVMVVGTKGRHRPEPVEPSAAAMATVLVTPAVTTSEVAAVGTVEVPSVDGMTQADAEVLLRAAGLSVEILGLDAVASVGGTTVVASQDPQARSLVSAGSTVTLTMVASAPKRVSKLPATSAGYVVCIDPGHQSRGDSSPEPVGPGAERTKPRVTGGATGVITGIPEYEIVLQISMNLKARLEQRGVKVVMTRTTSDVNISNAERAEIANKAHADLFIRMHCDGSPDEDVAGLSVIYPAANKWTQPIAAASHRSATAISASVLRSTGAVSRGLKARSDLSGFNWSSVPSVLVECGFLSNPVEDRLLASPHYQDKLASGMCDGILKYLEEVDE